MKVQNEKEFSEAMHDGCDKIEIEGDFAKGIIKIKATGKVAWAVAIGAISVAVIAVILAPPTGGSSLLIEGVVALPALSALGTAAPTAIAIAVASGGVSALNKLRDYKMEKISKDHIILHKN